MKLQKIQEETWAKQRMDANMLRKRIGEQKKKIDENVSKLQPVLPSSFKCVYIYSAIG